MVAHTATTPPLHPVPSKSASDFDAAAHLAPGRTAGFPHVTDPLRVSASPSSAPLPLSPSAPSLASHSDSWRSFSSLSSLLPAPTLTDEILDDLAVPQFSLAIVAQKHGLTLSGMLTWLNLPATREVLALRESAAYAHARHVAALNIGHAVETVASIVRDYNTTGPAREAQDRKGPGFAHRAATNARKAAWLLLQFARIVPVNEADLRRAKDASRTASPRVACLLEEQACSEPASAKSHATGCAVGGPTSAINMSYESALASASPLPSQRVYPAGALPNLPLASSLRDDANSSQVACLLEEQACSEAADSPHGCASAAMPPDQINAAPSPLPVPFPAAPRTPTPSLASRGPPW